MHAFVTGASGFIGSSLTARLIRDGWSVSALTRSPAPAIPDAMSRLQWIRGDLLECEGWHDAAATADVIFHLAGITRASSAEAFARGNLHTTQRLTQTMSRHGAAKQRLVFVSSLAASGPSAFPPGRTEGHPANPVSEYGRSKLLAEQCALQVAAERPVTILRPPVVYGPGDHGHLSLFQWACRGLAPAPGRRPFPMSMIHVDDLVTALVAVSTAELPSGRTYFVNDGACHDWSEVLDAVAGAVDRSPRRVPIPLPIIHGICTVNGWLARTGRRAGYLNPDKWNEIRQSGWLCDGSRIRAELSLPTPVSLNEGMRNTAAWYRLAGWL